MPRERQVSFAGGEISPTLYGRTDLAVYRIGVAKLFNFIVTPHGIAVNRSGTVHLQPVAGAGRVVAFVYSESDTADLVFTDLQLVVVVDGEVQATVTTPYTEAHLSTLRFAQIGNIVTIVSEHYAPRELVRDGSDWTLEEIDFDVPEPPEWAGEAKLLNQDNELGDYATDGAYFDGSTSRPARPWKWAITRVMRERDTGRLYETSIQVVTHEYEPDGEEDDDTDNALPSKVAVYPDWNQIVVWGTYGSLNNNDTPPDDADAVYKTRIYRGREGRYGFLGETTSNHFVDDGAIPDYSNPPPQGVNPFEVYDAEETLLRTEYPSVVAYFESRRLMGATPERPTMVQGSAVENFKNHDEIIPASDEDAFSLTVTSPSRIRALVANRYLVALTASSEFVIVGNGPDSLITPASLIAAREVSKVGCGSVAPVSVGKAIFFVQASGSYIHALIVGADGDAQVIDVTLFSRHLFDGYTIVDFAYAKNPYSVLWVVRSDGALLSLTYVPEQEMLAWARHELAGDAEVVSVAVRPNGGEDAVTFVVNRDGEYFLERFAGRVITDVRDGVFLDRSVTQDGAVSDTTATVVDGDMGDDLDLVFDPALGSPSDVVGAVLQIENPDGGRPLKLYITSYDGGSGVHTARALNMDVPEGIADTALAFSWCSSSVTGLSHLEGETVNALVDGEVIEDLVVNGGMVEIAPEGDFESYFAVAHVGLPYESDLETLDAAQGDGKEKIVKEVEVELEATRGGYVGQDFDNLTVVETREVSDEYATQDLKRIKVPVPVSGEYSLRGRAVYRQTAPLPCAVLGFTRDIELGG